MQKIKVISKCDVMKNEDSLFGYHAWPTVAKLQDGRLAVVASGFRRAHVCPFGKTVISFSNDEGKTWTLPSPVIDTPLDDRDGGILVYGEKNVIVTSFNNTIEAQRIWLGWRKYDWEQMPEGPEKEYEKLDIDFCEAYLKLLERCDGKREKLDESGYRGSKLNTNQDKYFGSTFRVSHDCANSFGPINYSPVTNPHGPLVTKDGRILYVGTPIGDFAHKVEDKRLRVCEILPDESVIEIGVIDEIFDDNGEKLSASEPHAIELNDGSILVHIRIEKPGAEYSTFTVYQTISKDGGKTFDTPKLVSITPNTLGEVDSKFIGAPPYLYRHSSGALISLVSVRPTNLSIRALISYDEGKSWDLYKLLDIEGQRDLGYPSVTELSDGTLFTTYYAHDDLYSPAIIKGIRWELPKK